MEEKGGRVEGKESRRMSRSEGKERRGREGKVSLQAAHLAGNGRDSKPFI